MFQLNRPLINYGCTFSFFFDQVNWSGCQNSNTYYHPLPTIKWQVAKHQEMDWFVLRYTGFYKFSWGRLCPFLCCLQSLCISVFFCFFFFFFSNGHSVQKVKLSWPCSVFQRRNVIHCSLIVELLFFIEYICLYLSLPLLSLPVSTVSVFISSFHAICCCFCVIVLLSVWSGGCGITLACKGNKYAYILSTSLSYRVGLFRLSRFFWLLEKFSGEENDWLII